jgi:WD40 repeat protein
MAGVGTSPGTFTGWSTVFVWDLETGRPLGKPLVHSQYVTGVQFSPDGRVLSSSGNDLTVRLWDANTLELLRVLRPQGNTVTAVAFTTDGRRLVSSQLDNTLKLWDPLSGEELLTLPFSISNAWGDSPQLAFGPDGRSIVAATKSQVAVWEAPARPRQLTLRGHSWAVRQTLLSRDGSRLATKSWAPEVLVLLWALPAGRPLLTLSGGTGMAFSPDGARFAVGIGEALTMYDAQTGARLWEQAGHLGGVGGSGVVFAPDGRTLAVTAGDAIVRIRDAASGAELLRIATDHAGGKRLPWILSPGYSGFGSGATVAAFSPDGALLATGGADGSVKLWDARTGRQLPLQPRRAAVNRDYHSYILWLAFDSNGQTLEAFNFGSVGGTTWDVTTGTLLPSASPKRTTVPLLEATAAGAPVRVIARGESVRVVDAIPPSLAERARWKERARFDADWHRAEANRHEREGRSVAAAFHLQQLLDRVPEDAEVCRRLAIVLSRSVDSASPWTVATAARAALHANDEAGYRAGRATLLEAFAHSGDPQVVAAATRTCALAPGTEKALPALAETALTQASTSGSRDDWCAAGGLLRRVGRVDDAERCFRRALALRPTGAAGPEELGLALTDHAHGRTAGARRWLQQVQATQGRLHLALQVTEMVGRCAAGLPAAASLASAPDPLARSLGWAAWREMQLLRREAQEVIGAAAAN